MNRKEGRGRIVMKEEKRRKERHSLLERGLFSENY